MFNTRIKKSFLLGIGFLCSLCSSSVSVASSPSFGLNFFKPTVDDSEYFSVYSSQNLRQGKYYFGLWMDYARRPYEVGNASFSRRSGIADNVLIADVVGSYALFDSLSVGLRLPVFLWENIDAPALSRLNENNMDMGDVELALKFKILDRKKHYIGLGVLPYLSIPTATNEVNNFTGNGYFSGGAKLLLDFKPHKRVSVATNIGYEMRNPTTDVAGNKIDDQFQGALGVSVDAIPRKLKVVAEGEVKSVGFFDSRRTTPSEARLGAEYSFASGVHVSLGGGLGLNNGISAPAYRVFSGVSFSKRPVDNLALKDNADELALKEDQDVYLVGDEIRLSEKLFFDYDKYNIREISKPILAKLAAFLSKHSELKKVRIEGHTCDLGSEAYNLKLSQKRAQAVVNSQLEQGVSGDRLRALGKGEANPVVPNVDEASREQNRRVQIFVEERNN